MREVLFSAPIVGVAVLVLGGPLVLGGIATLVRGRTIAPSATRTTNANTPGSARMVGALWIAIGVAFVVFGLR